jgi:hypothetical protein
MPKYRVDPGAQVGRLTVLHEGEPAPWGHRRWWCRCACGNPELKLVTQPNLVSGATLSCGCLRDEAVVRRCTKHGQAQASGKTPEYQVWIGLKKRCSRTGEAGFKNYGGRGITVSPEWVNDFAAFLREVGPRPTAKHTLERKDNSKGYEPGNCEWATRRKQTMNRRNARMVMYKGKPTWLPDACLDAGLPYGTVKSRMRLGWAEEDLFRPALFHR